MKVLLRTSSFLCSQGTSSSSTPFERKVIYENFIKATNAAKFSTLYYFILLYLFWKGKVPYFSASFPSMLLLCDSKMNNSLKNLSALLDYVCQLPSDFVCKSLTLHCDVLVQHITSITSSTVCVCVCSIVVSYLLRQNFSFMTSVGRFIIV